MTTDTDRDRLLLALDELRTEHDYFVPLLTRLQCCCTCAVAEVPAGAPYVVWHVQSHDRAFGFGADATCDQCVALYAGDDEVGEGFYAGDAFLHFLEHTELVERLSLHWAGDANLIVQTLRRHGLDARLPESEALTIFVVPGSPVGASR